MAASLCPQRLPEAALVSRATSASIKYSRVLIAELGRRTGTVRFTVVGAANLKRDFAIAFRSSLRACSNNSSFPNGVGVAFWPMAMRGAKNSLDGSLAVVPGKNLEF
jgi:hypothetical protein